MIRLVRTDSANSGFRELVKLLDEELSIRDGADHSFYDQFNKITAIKHAVVALKDEIPVACGAIKEFSPDTMEVKRMFVPVPERARGHASLVLAELENWAKELGYKRCILETGLKQPEAISLYKKNHYFVIPNYGQYENVVNSVCFEKRL